MSDKNQAFKRVAAKRVDNLLNNIRLLKNCSNTLNYEYSEQEVNKMFTEISKALKDCKADYDLKLNSKKSKGFKF
ncbi:MAG: hypothetical protein ACI9YE_000888 [Psychroserpens sp.]|jgi:hypothetical protein